MAKTPKHPFLGDLLKPSLGENQPFLDLRVFELRRRTKVRKKRCQKGPFLDPFSDDVSARFLDPTDGHISAILAFLADYGIRESTDSPFLRPFGPYLRHAADRLRNSTSKRSPIIVVKHVNMLLYIVQYTVKRCIM
jgi:hypothetical protein